MSRSQKKNPYIPVTTAASEKEDKTLANRKVRKRNRILLTKTEDDTSVLDRKTLTDPWAFSKDGKRRVDPEENEKYLRK